MDCDKEIYKPKARPINRTCYKCKEVKLLSEFRSRSSDSEGKDYLCKICDIKHRKKTSFPFKIPRKIPIERKCSKCQETKLMEFFYKDSRKFGGRKYECKDCAKKPHKKSIRQIRIPDWVIKVRKRLRDRQKKFGGNIVSSNFLLSLYEKQQGKCYYTGIEMDIVMDKKTAKNISVDRLDSNIGYTENNVVLCCLSINYCKNDLSEQEFLYFLDQIKESERT